jgi:hypothetical protein
MERERERATSVSQTFRLRLELHHQFSWVSSLQTATHGLLSLYHHVSQFLIINLSLYCKYLNFFLYIMIFWHLENPLLVEKRLILWGLVNFQR